MHYLNELKKAYKRKNLKKNIQTVIDIFMESSTNNFLNGVNKTTVSNKHNIYFTKLASL